MDIQTDPARVIVIKEAERVNHLFLWVALSHLLRHCIEGHAVTIWNGSIDTLQRSRTDLLEVGALPIVFRHEPSDFFLVDVEAQRPHANLRATPIIKCLHGQ